MPEEAGSCTIIYATIGLALGLIPYTVYTLRLRYRAHLMRVYLDGFRDGREAEVRTEYESRPRRVQVPLSERN